MITPKIAAAALVLGVVALAGFGRPSTQPAAQPAAAPADPNAASREAIVKTAQAFVDAFHKGDAQALSQFWTPDGDYHDLTGRVLKGRKAIAEDFAELFKENKGLLLRIEVGTIQFPTPDTAIEDGVTSVMSPDGQPPNRAKYTNFLVKVDGKWQLSSVRESHYRPPNHYEQLRPMEWAVGEWAEEAKEGHVAHIKFEWSSDQNFLMATRAVVVKGILLGNGSQRLGWDPAARTIRSWSFEDDGGFGQGVWTRNGDSWTVQSSSVLRSGSILTGTTTIKRLDADTITWQATGQRLDGKPIADGPVVKMKRVG